MNMEDKSSLCLQTILILVSLCGCSRQEPKNASPSSLEVQSVLGVASFRSNDPFLKVAVELDFKARDHTTIAITPRREESIRIRSQTEGLMCVSGPTAPLPFRPLQDPDAIVISNRPSRVSLPINKYYFIVATNSVKDGDLIWFDLQYRDQSVTSNWTRCSARLRAMDIP
jgi:hypothetical protein